MSANLSGVIPGFPLHFYNLDILFHSTISELFLNYGVSTIGLADLRPISYHTYSHEVMARISQLTNIAPVKLYAWLPLCFFGPLLFIVSTEFLDKYSQKQKKF